MEEKITKEMVETYLELHEKITDKLSEVLSVLVKINPERYSNVSFDYYNPDEDYFSVGGWDGCMGCYDWDSTSVPMKYLYDENWLEQEKQKLKEKEDKEKQEKLLIEQKEKERKEQRDKEEYERLKKKFEE